MYPVEMTTPMARELEAQGFTSLHNASDVDAVMSEKEGSVLVVVNSVCGCAARNARPGAVHAVQAGGKKPTRCVTVFAGVDTEATARAREFMMPYPPSSPSIALFQNGKLVHFLERHHIEGRPAEVIANNLIQAFEQYC